MYLGELIKAYREQENLTMAEFAAKCGLSKGYISMLEKNKHPQNNKEIVPSVETLGKVSSVLGISLNELLSVLNENQLVDISHSKSNTNQHLNCIGETLKSLREDKGLSCREVLEKLADMGINISYKTLYEYERGIISANVDMFLALCKIYECNDILNTFGVSDHPDVLFTNSELNHIKRYRTLDEHGKELIDTILKKEYERCASSTDKKIPDEFGFTSEEDLIVVPGPYPYSKAE